MKACPTVVQAFASSTGHMGGQVVDTESAREFMRETLTQITAGELDAIADSLEFKHARFRALLSRERLAPPALLGEDDLRTLLRSIFCTRRRVKGLLASPPAPQLGAWTGELLYGPGAVDARFQQFCDRLEGLPHTIRYDLASEILHFTQPQRYWLWTLWMWDPQTRTGALPLVTMEGHDLEGDSVGATYLRVGRAIAFVHETGRAVGFTRIGQGDFGVDVYLACVYAVYVYTAVRMRMTQEFNRVIPPLPELCRRFLGVYAVET